MSYSIRILQDTEMEQANQLFLKVYGKERPDSFFKWEFQFCPEGSAIYVGAFDGDKLIGTQAAIPLNFISSSGDVFLTGKSEDTLLDPDYRGKGLFNKMYELLIEECKSRGVATIWGFTSAKKPFANLGFDIPFDTISGLYVINPFASYRYLSELNARNKLKEKCLIFGLSFYSWLKAIIYPGKLSKQFKSGVFKEQDGLTKAVLSDKGLFKIQESDDYLKWRIKENPYPNNYFEIIAEDANGQVMASVIFNIRREKYAYIERMLFHPSFNSRSRADMIKHCIHLIRKSKNISLVRFWGIPSNEINSEEINLLKRCGFYFVKKGTGFVYLPLSNKAPKPELILLSRLYTQGNI